MSQEKYLRRDWIRLPLLDYTQPVSKRDWVWLTANGKPPLQLTYRQNQVIELLLQGYRTKAIAHELGLSHIRVSQHLKTIRKKLGAETNAQAIYLLLK